MADQTYIERISRRLMAGTRAEPARAQPSVRPSSESASAVSAAAQAGVNDSAALAVGTSLASRYELAAFVGHGRYGPIYEARDGALSPPDTTPGFRVWLHLLRSGLRDVLGLLTQMEQFIAEPQAWSHPGILRIVDIGRDGATHFVVTEHVEGITLRGVLEESAPAPLSRDEAFAVLNRVGDALKYAHAKGAVHGAVRPENVFLTLDYGIKLLDLWPLREPRSLAWFVEDIEVGATREADPRDDVYGLACVAYEMLAGKHPFNANSALEAFHHRLTAAPVPGLTPSQWETLRRGLALHRDQRIGSVAELLDGLGVTGRERLRPPTAEPAAASAPPAPPRPAPPDPRIDTEPVRPRSDASERTVKRPLASPPLPPEPWIDSPPIKLRSAENARAPKRPLRGWLGATAAILMLGVLGVGAYVERATLRDRVTGLIAGFDRRPDAAVAGDRATESVSEPREANDATVDLPREGAEDSSASLAADAARTTGARAPDLAEPEPQAALDGPLAGAAAEPAVFTPTVDIEGSSATTLQTPTIAADATDRSEALQAQPVAAAQSASAASAPTQSDVPAADVVAKPEVIASSARAGIGFDVPSLVVSERDLVARITISRADATAAATAVWSTAGDSAQPGEDYVDLGAAVERFAVGEQFRVIYVPLIVDNVREEPERFFVYLRTEAKSSSPDEKLEVVIVDDVSAEN